MLSASVPSARCPVTTRSGPETAGHDAALPPQGAERAAILVLRFLAAARDTGDACCWDAALDQAEAAFGERRAPLVVGYAGTLTRRLARFGADIGFLPPPCRRLSSGEARLLGALRAYPSQSPRLEFGPVAEEVAALAQSIAPIHILRTQRA